MAHHRHKETFIHHDLILYLIKGPKVRIINGEKNRGQGEKGGEKAIFFLDITEGPIYE